MTEYAAHTPKHITVKAAADTPEFFALVESLRLAIITRRLVEHPQYSGE